MIVTKIEKSAKPTKAKLLWSTKFLWNFVGIEDFRSAQKSLIFDIWNSQNFTEVKF